MKRRDFLKTASLAVSAIALPANALAKGKTQPKPNFIIIFTDDQGYQDIECFGSPLIKTPNLDKMADEGMRFTDFYSASAVCTPSRAALLTGCYPPRVGLVNVLFPESTTGLNPAETNIANTLKARGYATACVGKWHLGWQKKFMPTNQGFDYYYGIPYSNDMLGRQAEPGKAARPELPMIRNNEIIEAPVIQSTITKRYTEEAVKFIKTSRDKPFFLYLPHSMPHIPLYASEDFKDKSKRGLYGDVIEEIDWSTGEILKTLKKLGIDDNTLVIYTSDNGPWLIKGENGGSALPLRGGKMEAYEGGFREPCIMRWPKKIPAGSVCKEVCSTIDILPTLAGLSGEKLKPANPIDGKDISDLMTGIKSAKSPHKYYYYFMQRSAILAAVRYGRWKLHTKYSRLKIVPGENGKLKKKFYTPGIELYDLENDIAETTNVAGDHPEIVKQLTEQIKTFDEEIKRNARQQGRV